MRRRGAPAPSALVLLALLAAARAEGAPAAAVVDPVTVVGVSPLPGTGVDIDKTPGAVSVLSTADLSRGGAADALGALSDQLSGVSLADNLDDAFQPDLLLRGFAASPVLGTPQGVAVYMNGVRLNEAFGDTVDWDLVPDLAIRRLDVLDANPVFGLNALGGAVVIAMKTGFSDPGGALSLSGGSFARRSAQAEYGANDGRWGLYLAARGLDEDGWRAFSPDHLRQAYADLATRQGPLTLDLAVTAADNRLGGESAAPAQELSFDRSLVFTNPQSNHNRLVFVTLNADWKVSRALSLQGVLFYRGLKQDVVNGNTTGFTACGGGAGLLCQGDGATPLVSAAGGPIPDLSAAGDVPIGELDRERIRTDGLGASLQATSSARLAGRGNHLVVGASLDTAATDYASSVEVGVIGPGLRVQPSGYLVSTPETSPFTATPVALRADTAFVGLYASDTVDLTSRLSVTASARYNIAKVDLADRRGAALDGRNTYRRLDPALGAAYRFGPGLTVYGGYSEGSRAPNPSEIECADPQRPCLLPSTLASDPPTLRQVVSRTWEAGLRGRAALAGGALTWTLGAFRTDVGDDIYPVATSLGAGYFRNIGDTRRQGLDLGARYAGGPIVADASYSYLEATFRSAFVLPSPANPFGDASGDIRVRPGDQLPGVPRHRLKLGADLTLRRGWTVGAALSVLGDQYYRGDESNQLARLPGYAVLGLHSNLEVGRRAKLFVDLANALDARYATFGVLGDPTGVGAPGVPASGADPRFLSPAAPLAVSGGLELRF